MDAERDYMTVPSGRPCGEDGPSPFPEGRGYRCSLPVRHEGPHEAWADGRFLDSWPAIR